MQFKNIIGQQKLIKQLINTVKENRISHTQLFLGAEGCGNLAMALAYAQYINCLQPLEQDSCGNCSSCVKFNKLAHPDLHFTVPTISPFKFSKEVNAVWRDNLLANSYITETDWIQLLAEGTNKQGNITAEECRELITQLSYKSYEAKYKIHIIWLPEYLEKNGNILLKLLEEPPPNTLILLVATEIDRILPTILSRAQTTKIPRIDDESVKRALVERYQLDADKANDICRIAEGNFAYVLKLLQVEETGYYENFSSWMRVCYTGKIDDIQKWVDNLNNHGKEYIKSFITYSLQMIRAGFVYKYGNKSLLRINPNEIAFLENFSKFISQQNLPGMVEEISNCIYLIERNANVKIMFLNLSLYIGKQIKSAQQAA